MTSDSAGRPVPAVTIDDEERTVCVWENGGVYHPEDDRIRKDIVSALGADDRSVVVTDVEDDDRGVWLTVRIYAPFVPADWNR